MLRGPLPMGAPFTWNLEWPAAEFGFYSMGWDGRFDAQNFLGKGQESEKGDLSYGTNRPALLPCENEMKWLRIDE